jgi:hypothetical protein
MHVFQEIAALVFQFNFYWLQPVFCYHAHRLAVRKSRLDQQNKKAQPF